MEKPTLEQQRNLIILANGLADLPADYKHFDMRDYFRDPSRGLNLVFPDVCDIEPIHYNGCGAVACALGHGPAFGIKPLPTERYWDEYRARAFGVRWPPAAAFLFDIRWAAIDNTPLGGAERILAFLKNGCEVPAEYPGWWR